MTTSPSEILSTTEAAARCGVSPETIRRWIRTKGLPAYNTTLGMNIRIRLSDLQAFALRHNILLRASRSNRMLRDPRRPLPGADGADTKAGSPPLDAPTPHPESERPPVPEAGEAA